MLATLGCKRVVCSDADITHARQTVARNADVLKAKPEVVRIQLGRRRATNSHGYNRVW